MVDPIPLYQAVEAALKAVPGVTVYDGYVPTKVPEAGGHILPYVVNWFGVGANPEEPSACGIHDTDTLILDFQTTIVGANPAICRAVAAPLRAALTNLRVGTGRIKPNPDGFNQQAPILDTTITPARFMLPLHWRLTTN